ncbi:MAG: integrase core domain-containing protein [Gemmatimonadota bacterium]
MSTAAKVELARGAVAQHGLRTVLSVLGLPRSTWYYHRAGRRSYGEKYAELRAPLEAIARTYPEYGYRRASVELRESHGRHHNHKVVQRLHQLWDLPLLRGSRPPKPSGIRQALAVVGSRANLVAGLERIDPFEVLYTDFTELVYLGGRAKAFLIAFLDHASKVALGWAVGERAVTSLALEAWERAVRRLAGFGLSARGCIVHHDQDPVFTGYAWTHRLLIRDRCRLSYALRGARDNPEMESFYGRFKTENRSLLLEAGSIPELDRVVGRRMSHYNRRRRHSSLGYRTPSEFVHTLVRRGRAPQS